MTLTIIIVVAVVAILIMWGIGVQNKLVKSDEFCKNSLKQINVQQISRFDAIKSLVKLAREYAQVEADNLSKVIASRQMTASANPTAKEVNGNEAFLTQVSSKLFALAEQYPDLKANTNYNQAMSSIKEYEENVRLSRMTFNDSVTRYNNNVRMFPASLIASMLGFAQREYLEEDKTRTEFPEI